MQKRVLSIRKSSSLCQASFDEEARELTVEAARSARLDNLTLLEEPLAAFLCVDRGQPHMTALKHEDLRDGELILICDIGGGTTDFSLVRARLVNGELQFERTAIGEHLLLGGDNLDLRWPAAWKRSSKTSSSRCGSVMHYAGPAVQRKSGC